MWHQVEEHRGLQEVPMRILILALSLLIASSLATAGQAQQYGAPGAPGYYSGYAYDPNYYYGYPAYGYPGYGYPYYYGPSIGVFYGGGWDGGSYGGSGGGWHGGHSR
jgi:hypothetical protein